MTESSRNFFNILLVDDEPLILETIGLFLEDEGFGITTADSGQAGIDALSNREFDLILTDLTMPDLNGFDVTNAAQRFQPDTPVIILTGLGTSDNAAKASHSGAYGIVSKPVLDLNAFLTMIRRALDEGKPTNLTPSPVRGSIPTPGDEKVV